MKEMGYRTIRGKEYDRKAVSVWFHRLGIELKTNRLGKTGKADRQVGPPEQSRTLQIMGGPGIIFEDSPYALNDSGQIFVMDCLPNKQIYRLHGALSEYRGSEGDAK